MTTTACKQSPARIDHQSTYLKIAYQSSSYFATQYFVASIFVASYISASIIATSASSNSYHSAASTSLNTRCFADVASPNTCHFVASAPSDSRFGSHQKGPRYVTRKNKQDQISYECSHQHSQQRSHKS